MFEALLALSVQAAEPDFTMRFEPGQRYTAELFILDGGIRSPRLADQLGIVPDRAGPTAADGLLALQGRAQDGAIVVLVGSDEGRVADRVCRMRQGEGDIDNSRDAIRWCLSFFNPPTLTVAIPRPVAPAPPR